MLSARSALGLNEREYQEALLLSAAKGTDEIDFVARGTKVNDLMEPGCQSLFIGTIIENKPKGSTYVYGQEVSVHAYMYVHRDIRPCGCKTLNQIEESFLFSCCKQCHLRH